MLYIKEVLGCREPDAGDDMVEMTWVMINDQAKTYH